MSEVMACYLIYVGKTLYLFQVITKKKLRNYGLACLLPTVHATTFPDLLQR